MRQTTQRHQCHACKKSFVRHERLALHVEFDHPRQQCIRPNSQKLSREDRLVLASRLQQYADHVVPLAQLFGGAHPVSLHDAVSMYSFWNGVDPISDAAAFVWCSHQLLPQKYIHFSKKHHRPASIQAVLPTTFPAARGARDPWAPRCQDRELVGDLKRITRAHVTFCRRVQECGAAAVLQSWLPVPLTQVIAEFVAETVLHKALSGPKQLDRMLDDFQRFLNLGYHWTGSNLCPTLIIDLVWHAAMMNFPEYLHCTTRFVGKLLPHCLEENEGDKKKKDSRVEFFCQEFLARHREPPLSVETWVIERQEDGGDV